jgi:hypothetical protein
VALLLKARAGVAGIISSLMGLGIELMDVPTSALTPKKYTVGPAWTGAEFATIQSAVDQAALDGHSTSTVGTNVLLELYAGRFTENVVVPETLPRFVVVGVGAGDIGSTLDGTLTINMPSTGSSVAIEGVEFLGAFSLVQAPPTGTTSLRLSNCSFFSTFAVASVHATLGCTVQAFACEFLGLMSVTCRSWRSEECRLGSGATNSTISCTSTNEHYQTRMGTTGSHVFNLNGSTVWVNNSPQLYGRFNLSGTTAVWQANVHGHAGSPAVQDATTGSAFCQGNTFTHDAGAAGPVWVKTGGGIFHDGGNVFAEGQQYPWFSFAGTRSDRGESDDELRRVLSVSGSPVLTASQVGSQRKTTVAKSDGGGTVTLPSLATVEPGCTVILKDSGGNAGGANITFAAAAGEKIDAAASVLLTVDYEALEVQALNATDWIRIGHYP